jgi:hypothetical protein
VNPDINRDRYLSVPLSNGCWNIFVNEQRDILNDRIELNKFLTNVCIIQVNEKEMNPQLQKPMEEL